MLKSFISERFRNARHEKGLTQKQAAELIGVHEVVYARYEQGTSFPQFRLLPAVAQVLDLPIRWLLDQRMDWRKQRCREE